MAQTLPHVTVLGLGAMGHAFASNLIKKEFPVAVWNRSADKADDLIAMGAVFYKTSSSAVLDADIVIAMLVDGQVTLEIINEIIGYCKEGAIFCQMGTIGVAETKQAYELLKEKRPDMIYIDAPVSGTKKPAEEGALTIFAGCDQDHPSIMEAVFDTLGKKTIWFDRVGASQEMKLVVNSLLILMMQGVVESMQLAKHFGFTPTDFWSALDGGALSAPYIKGKLTMIASDDYTPQMQLQHAIKDANLALENAPKGTMPEMEMVIKLWEKASQEGLSHQDLSSIYTYLNKQ